MENKNNCAVSIINDTNDKLIQVQKGFAAMENIYKTSTEFILQCKQIELQIHQLDVQYDALIAKMNYDLLQAREKKQTVIKALDTLNNSMMRTLDKVLEMDEGDMEIKMKLKFSLLETLNKCIDSINNIMMRYL